MVDKNTIMLNERYAIQKVVGSEGCRLMKKEQRRRKQKAPG